MKPIAILLGIALALGACSSGGDAPMAEDERGLQVTRNSSFENRSLRVFLTLRSGDDRSVDQYDGSLRGRPAAPIPGHAAEEWDFFRQTAEGTSEAFALVSYDADDPADYLMMGWWLEFPGQWGDRTRAGSVPAVLIGEVESVCVAVGNAWLASSPVIVPAEEIERVLQVRTAPEPPAPLRPILFPNSPHAGSCARAWPWPRIPVPTGWTGSM